jgi:hypothetical protein
MTSNTLRVQRTVIYVSVLSLGLCSLASASSWIHEVSDATSPHVGAFRMKTVAEEDGRLIGSATYHEVGHDVAVKIEGVEMLDGRFWPNAIVEAANDWNGPWKRLDQVKVSGRAVTFTFRFAEANPILYITLDPFRPVIGKMRYGRIVLPNGYDTLFELSEILPDKTTNASIEDDWELPILHGYLADPLAEGPFFVGRVAFSDGHLRVEAGYLDPEATSATVIEGSSEEDFWASATLQVANDPNGGWKTVGQAATPGKSATITIQPNEKSIKTLNIGVDILRPMVGKFGYGRALLKNGKAAAFELYYLLPPKDRR